MCGIAGIVDLEGRREIDRLALERMTEALEHRGPDGHGYHLEPGLGFGHRRLAIIDEAGGRQPYTASGGTVICYNGEIYNHREVREDLTRAGRQFRTRSDTEVLAELMDLRGPEGLPELQGMFAFAAWDPRNETLTLARDRLGEKPLYTYITRDGFLVFASEIDAMLAGGLVTPVIDSTSVADYLFYGYVPDPKTIYRGIRKLPPAHELTIRRGRDVPPPRRWWSLRMKPDQGCRFEAALETMLPTLDEAVSDQMISDRPIAAFLSGGVDSSAVASSMQIGREAKVTTCAMGFDDPAYDERGPAAEVARHLGTDHREFVTHFDPAFLIPAVAAIYGEPFADTSAVPTVLLCKGARQHSVVALSGDGGDEIFAGYGRYDGILQEARIRQFLPEVARRSVFRAAGHLYPAFPPSVPAPFRLKTALQSVSEEPEAGYARAVSAILPDRCRALLAPEMRDYEPQSIIESAMVAADISDPVLAAQAVDMVTWMPGRMLVKVDRASMASGLEVRPPLLDHRLVEWAATLPRSFKLKGPTAKRILKEALKPRLPADILARQKQGFGAPVDGWFRDDGGALIDNLMARDAWRDSGYFSPDRVRELAKRHRTGRGQHGQELWSVLMFDAFLTRQSCNRSLLDEIPSINAPSIAREAVA
ncbi:asparagine synthase (glutamine-hydrolyzing) [Parvularcula marina]|uniref:asparagine synthase (glutamine-hydrolyzing) n=1 Tax=Parvularcula marina TaxID=2292771 RepID=UPI003516E2FB